MAVETLITLPLSESLLKKLESVSPKLHITVLPAQKAADIPNEIWGRTEILYTASVLPDPEQAPALRWIQFHFAGIDHYVAHPIFEKEDLMLTTLSGAAVSQMAEHVLTMILAFSHHLPALLESQRKAEWPKDRFERFTPVELRGQTVGVVGYGSIGRQVARMLLPFGARILATKRDVLRPTDSGYRPPELDDAQGEVAQILFPPQALRSMLKECRFVVVSAPLTAQTRGMFDAQAFNVLKPGAFLIDISRGGIVDHTALLAAIKDGRLAGAALDVFPEEPLPETSPLWKTPGVIISPHVSGNSAHYNERAVELFSENLRRYLGGLAPYNLFDPEQGY